MATADPLYDPAVPIAAIVSIGTGLTLSGAGALTNDLLTGKAGGQTVIGGTAASEILTLQSTSHATRGTVKIGSVAANTAFNLDITDATKGNFLWGTATVQGALSYSGAGPVSMGSITNHLLALTSNNVVMITTGIASAVTCQTIVGASATLANANLILRSDSKSWTLGNGTYASADDVFSITDGTSFYNAISTTGNVALGASVTVNTAAVLATNAADHHVLLPTCAGPPTGAAPNGAIIIDTTNGKLYLRIGGAWVGGTAPGLFV